MLNRLPAPGLLRKISLPLGLALLAACTPDAPTEQRKAGAATSPAAASAADKLQRINVFVDMSGGMQGFVHAVAPGAAGSGFQQTVTELLSDVNARRGQLATAPAYYFFKEKTAQDQRLLVPSTYADMRAAVSGGIKNAARGSELPQMLSEALKLQAQKPGSVSLLISDFIFAPQNQGQTWDVKTFIKDALSEVEASKLAVSVFANTSEYRGNFYPGNRSGAQKLNGEQVPYYIWALGDPSLVAQLDAGLLHRLAGQPQAHFNVRFAPPYAVLDYLEPVGRWMAPTLDTPGAVPQVVLTEKPTPGAPAEVVVGLDLRPLPPRIAAQTSLQTLHVANADGLASLVRVWPLAQEPAVKAQPALGKYTHFARLRVLRAPAAPTTLALQLARTEPDWLASYSTNSDSNIKAQGAKTFHLREVLAGVADYFAEQPSAQRVFSLPVQVSARR